MKSAPAPRRTIQVLPLGPVALEDLKVIADTVRALYACACEILPSAPLPQKAWNQSRSQMDADVVLEVLFDRLDGKVLRLIGVTEADLYAEGRNFVFGYAHMRDRVAVFSTLRLRESYWGRPDDAALYRARVDKALTHELGHTFHTPHCERPRCVMHQVEFLWQLDELEPRYCAGCEASIESVASRGVDGAETLFELAGSYMRRRRFARAAATYLLASQKDPRNAHYINDYGVALLALGDRRGAASAFQKAVRLQPDFPHAYYNLGIVSRERGDTRTADWFFHQAIERDEDKKAANRYLGILHQDYFRDAPRARAFLERYRSLGGEDADVLQRLRSLARGGGPVMEELRVRAAGTESTAPA